MAYLSPAFLRFFEELAKNNHADWFKPRKDTYEAEVKRPFERLVTDLLARLAAEEPELGTLQPKRCIHRIYRDVRFSKDKTPYKTHASAYIALSGPTNIEMPGFYFQIGQDGHFVGGGSYAPSNPALYRIRQEIVYHTDTWNALLAAPDFRNTYGEIQGEQLKTAPRDFKDEAADLPILRNKQFFFGADLSDKLVTSDALLDELVRMYQVARPVNAFLRRALTD